MIGVDIVDLRKIELKDSFVKYVLTNEELNEFLLLNNDKRKKEYLGGRFAVKEAIFKATQDIHYLNYSCLNKDNGQPYILNHNDIEVSISHDGDYVVGFVMIK